MNLTPERSWILKEFFESKHTYLSLSGHEWIRFCRSRVQLKGQGHRNVFRRKHTKRRRLLSIFSSSHSLHTTTCTGGFMGGGHGPSRRVLKTSDTFPKLKYRKKCCMESLTAFLQIYNWVPVCGRMDRKGEKKEWTGGIRRREGSKNG